MASVTLCILERLIDGVSRVLLDVVHDGERAFYDSAGGGGLARGPPAVAVGPVADFRGHGLRDGSVAERGERGSERLTALYITVRRWPESSYILTFLCSACK